MSVIEMHPERCLGGYHNLRVKGYTFNLSWIQVKCQDCGINATFGEVRRPVRMGNSTAVPYLDLSEQSKRD